MVVLCKLCGIWGGDVKDRVWPTGSVEGVCEVCGRGAREARFNNESDREGIGNGGNCGGSDEMGGGVKGPDLVELFEADREG